MNGPNGCSPKTIKIFANVPTPLDFDRAISSEAIQTVDISKEEKKLANLKFVKFQNVHNIQLFIYDNDGGTDKTIVNMLRIFGQPLSSMTNMQEFKRVIHIP